VEEPPYTSVDSSTSLIVNADDLGYTPGVNRGIFQAHQHGIVTSSSLMVDQPAAEEAAAYARARTELSVGLHVQLQRWRVPRLSWRSSRTGQRRLQAQAALDLRRQLERFRGLMGSDPTHLDSHQHRHRVEALQPLFMELANELGVPLRQFDSRVRFCGDFYGQIDGGRPNPSAIAPEALVELFEDLPAGVTELCTHPGYAEDLKTTYRLERAREVATLCDPSVREAIRTSGIRLISFHDLAARPGSGLAVKDRR
jgi:chitin disaccharide deacetylase